MREPRRWQCFDVSSIFLYSPRCDGGFMHLLSMEESNNKLNLRSMTTRSDLLPRFARLRATAPFRRCACAHCANYPRIACTKRRSKLSATKSADGANPHFAPNVYMRYTTRGGETKEMQQRLLLLRLILYST